jgi:hypothetical protein
MFGVQKVRFAVARHGCVKVVAEKGAEGGCRGAGYGKV